MGLPLTLGAWRPFITTEESKDVQIFHGTSGDSYRIAL
jgi:hypothetical protein